MEMSSATEILAVVSACVIVWSLLAARLERLNVTAPIAFVLLALVVTHGPTAFIHLSLGSSAIRTLAEIALAVILFVDASRVNARRLLADVAIPIRLLGIALPLTIGAGTVVAAALFGENGLWVAALLGAIVAPTDAALECADHGRRTGSRARIRRADQRRERAERRHRHPVRQPVLGRCGRRRERPRGPRAGRLRARAPAGRGRAGSRRWASAARSASPCLAGRVGATQGSAL